MKDRLKAIWEKIKNFWLKFNKKTKNTFCNHFCCDYCCNYRSFQGNRQERYG